MVPRLSAQAPAVANTRQTAGQAFKNVTSSTLKDVSVDDFAGYMNNLGLPHPKKMDIAVPANLQCGQPLSTLPQIDEPRWGALTFTFGGIWEIQPQALEELSARVEELEQRK